MKFDFRDQVIAVTGGGSGIGAAIVRALLDAHARVAVLDIREPEKSDAVFLKTNVCDSKEMAASFNALSAQDFPLCGLVQCAGITRDAMLWKLTEESWDEVLDVNLKGAFLGLKHAMPLMRQRGGGAVVNISSINGLRGKLGQANYAASKAGLVGLSKTAAKEGGRFNIRVNVVAPGLVLTPMISSLGGEVREKAIAESALGRASTPEDIAHAVLFLLSDSARMITGEVLKVDGGQYI